MSLPAGVTEYDDVAVPQVHWGSMIRYHKLGETATPCGLPMAAMVHPMAAGDLEARGNLPCADCWPDTRPPGLWPVLNGRP